jgi:hypothetical protein
MQLAAVPRWQWIAVAIVAGAIVGWVTDLADSQLFGINIQGYGMLLPDQQQFENSLIQDYKGIRLFSNPVVHPHWATDPSGKRKLVYIVSGQYWNGQEEIRDGQTVAEWVPRCIITQTPYKPRIAVSDASNSAVAEFPSVVEFLDALHRNNSVSYRYAWWGLHPVLIWVAGCALVIGGVWPTLINLLAFGSLTRPKEVKPISLWNVRRSKTPQAPKISYVSSPPEADEQPSPPPLAPVGAEDTQQVAVVPLGNAPLELVPEGPREHRAYGADRDDFYPTERHAARQKSGE